MLIDHDSALRLRRAKLEGVGSYLGLGRLFGVVLVFLFLVRSSVVTVWYDSVVLIQAPRVILGLAAIYLAICREWNIQVLALIFVFSTVPGVLLSGHIGVSGLRWGGWAILFMVVGPLLMGPGPSRIRAGAWWAFRFGLIGMGVASFAWHQFGLPNLGRGAFTGVTLHSMVIGPVAGLGFLFALQIGVASRSLVAISISIACLVPCLLSGSRSAVAAALVGALVSILLTISRAGFRRSILALWTVGGLAIVGLSLPASNPGVGSSVGYTSALQGKGLVNTREALWTARLNEFEAHPIFGVGIGVDSIRMQGVIGVEDSLNIEPGSSYLTVLSMSGLSGSVVLALMLIGIVRRLLIHRWIWNLAVCECVTVGAFFAVHMFAEGYIYAVGNPLCLLLWLCLGRACDLAQGMRSSAGTRLLVDDVI